MQGPILAPFFFGETMQLRPYQQEAVNVALSYVLNSVIRIVLELATGAGKSLIIAELARLLYEHTGQRTIVLAPNGDLIKQNAAKFRALGLECSIFSASGGEKTLKHPIVFATPGTLINALDQLQEKVAAVIIDEGDGITDQIKAIVDHFSEHNRDLRMIALTATPYRTGEGYIFKQFEDGQTANVNAYYDKRVYRVTARQLIDMGYLVDVVTSPVPIEYDTASLKRDRRGKFTPASVEKTFIGKGRRTSQVVAEIVRRQQFYRACIIFCASRQHAAEVMQSLPDGTFAYIDGDTSTKDRAGRLARFRHGQITYLVNVDVLTVGTDLPIADHLALLRKTESDRLLQQIIGRGLRLHPNKEHCLLSDFAGNLSQFLETGRDIFDPEILNPEKKEKAFVSAICPKCAHVNQFVARPNPEKLRVNADGVFVDLAGDPMEYEIYMGEGREPQKVPFAAHYGRRCNGFRQRGPKGRIIRCNHTWQEKRCPACNGKNDIAAKQCKHCGKELADPNRYLLKVATEVVTAPDGWKMGTPKKVTISEYSANSGRRLLMVSFTVIGRATPLVKYYDPSSTYDKHYAAWTQFLLEGFGDDQLTVQEVLNRRKRFIMPEVVSWKKVHKQATHPEIRMYWRLPGAKRPA